MGEKSSSCSISIFLEKKEEAQLTTNLNLDGLTLRASARHGHDDPGSRARSTQ